MNEKHIYSIECYLCDSIVSLTVIDNTERPTYCPMCGTEGPDVTYDGTDDDMDL